MKCYLPGTSGNGSMVLYVLGAMRVGNRYDLISVISISKVRDNQKKNVFFLLTLQKIIPVFIHYFRMRSYE